MEGDHGQLPAGLQRAFGGHEPLVKFAVLVVDRDAQRLERARRRMRLARLGARQAGFDDLGKAQGRGDRLLLARFHDGAGDAAAGALFAVVEQDVGDLHLGRGVHDVGGAFAVLRHAHVEGAVLHEGKAALGKIKLHGGYPEVEHDAVEVGGVLVQIGEYAGLHYQALAKLRRPCAGKFERQRVAVDRDDTVRACVEETAGVASSTKGAIEPRARNRRDLRQQRT